MIENIVKSQTLDNDVAVMKIIQLMGQLSVNDLSYVLRMIAQVYKSVASEDVSAERTKYLESQVYGGTTK